MRTRPLLSLAVAPTLLGCWPHLSGYEVVPVDQDRRPGPALPPAPDCSAPLLLGPAGYREGFEGGANGWGTVAEQGRSVWEIGDPGEGPFAGSPGGGAVAATGLNLAYPDDHDASLVSPCSDASGLASDLLLELSRTVDSESRDRATVEVRVDGGEWTAVDGETRLGWHLGTAGFSGPRAWETAATLLEGTAGRSTVQLRVRFRSDFDAAGPGFAFDDVVVREATGDLALTLREHDRCGYVDAVVENVGGQPVDAWEVISNIDGVMDVQSFETTLDYRERRELLLGAALARRLTVRVFAAVDPTTDDDERSFTFTAVPFGAGYASDFEEDDGRLEVTGENPSRERGAPAGEVIRAAASGAQAWVTNLDGPNNANEDSALRLPCMDMSGLTEAPIVSLSRVLRTEGFGVDDLALRPAP